MFNTKRKGTIEIFVLVVIFFCIAIGTIGSCNDAIEDKPKLGDKISTENITGIIVKTIGFIEINRYLVRLPDGTITKVTWAEIKKARLSVLKENKEHWSEKNNPNN